MDFGLCFDPFPPLGIGLISVARREAYVLSFSLLLCLEPCKKFSVGGGEWVGGWIHSKFSVLLWSKALVLDLDQAEQ